MVVLQDEILHKVANASLHIYFIPGNPGLISYYATFLSLLSKRLNESHDSPGVCVYGKSLSGFEVAASTSVSEKYSGQLIDLDGQVKNVEQSLHDYCAATNNTGSQNSRPRIILIGHSVGTYILLEVLRRHKQAATAPPCDIVAGILLFPTIIDLAVSPRGEKVVWFATLKYFYAVMGAVAWSLTWALTGPMLSWAIARVTGMPSNGATVTEAFIKSEWGVRESLYLARDELQSITVDKWDDDIWQSASGKNKTSLQFYFGKEDPWVSPDTRQKLIDTRGQSPGVNMEVDELNIPHDFCIRHSELIAGQVSKSVKHLLNIGTI